MGRLSRWEGRLFGIFVRGKAAAGQIVRKTISADSARRPAEGGRSAAGSRGLQGVGGPAGAGGRPGGGGGGGGRGAGAGTPGLAGRRRPGRRGAAQRRRRGAAFGRPKNRPKGGLPCGPLPVPAQMCEGDCRKTDRPCGVRPFPPAWPRCGGGGCTWRCARCGRGHRF